MAELLSMVFDDDDDGGVNAMYGVRDVVLQLKQRPVEGREYNQDKEDLQEYAMQHPEEEYHPSSTNGEYDSAFPNVGLVIWQSGFVLADYLLRAAPLGPLRGLAVLELGCGTGQLGIVLGLAGADVVLTDLAHITPLTQENVDANASSCAIKPRVAPYMWGTPASGLTAALQQQQKMQQQQQQEKQQQEKQQQEKQQETKQQQQEMKQHLKAGGAEQQQEQGEEQQQQQYDMIVAADVLYEPQHYDALLASLVQLCPAAATAAGPSPPVFIAYRVRRYGEHGFESKAAKCGFAVTALPIEELHADFQCGGYRVIRLDRTGPAAAAD